MVAHIDYGSYPHLVDLILGFSPCAPWNQLSSLRQLSADIRDRVDRIQLEHVVFGDGTTSAIYHGVAVRRVPALLPLQSSTSGYSIQAGHYASAVERIERCTKTVDIVGEASSGVKSLQLSVPAVRIRPDWKRKIAHTPPWKCRTLVMFTSGPYALKPCRQLKFRIRQGLTKLVLHPSWGGFSLEWKGLDKSMVIPLVVVFPSYANSVSAIGQVDALLHAKGNFFLTLVDGIPDLVAQLTDHLDNKYHEEQNRKLDISLN
jgi:hypothetical protein